MLAYVNKALATKYVCVSCQVWYYFEYSRLDTWDNPLFSTPPPPPSPSHPWSKKATGFREEDDKVVR